MTPTPTIITTGTRVRALSHLGEKILGTRPAPHPRPTTPVPPYNP